MYKMDRRWGGGTKIVFFEITCQRQLKRRGDAPPGKLGDVPLPGTIKNAR